MIIDGVVSGLLLITIIYCWRLSRKVSALNASKKELRAIINEFNQAIVRAESGISNLKNLSKEADENLQQHIDKARFLTNDLAFLSHKGNNVAEKLEDYIRGMRSIDKTGTVTPRASQRPNMSRITTTPTKVSAPVEKQPMTQASHQSLGWPHVERPTRTAPPPIEKPTENEMTASKKQALEELLEQIAERKKKVITNEEKKGTAGSDNVAEPEVFEATNKLT